MKFPDKPEGQSSVVSGQSPPTDWNLPFMWLLPVHPKCREITVDQVHSFVSGLPPGGGNGELSYRMGRMIGAIMIDQRRFGIYLEKN